MEMQASKEEERFEIHLVLADVFARLLFDRPLHTHPFCPLINYQRRNGKCGKSNRVKARPSNVPESLPLSVNAV